MKKSGDKKEKKKKKKKYTLDSLLHWIIVNQPNIDRRLEFCGESKRMRMGWSAYGLSQGPD